MLQIDLCGDSSPLSGSPTPGPHPTDGTPSHNHQHLDSNIKQKTGFLPGYITDHMFCTGDVLAFTPALEMSKNEDPSRRQHHADMEECLYLFYTAVC